MTDEDGPRQTLPSIGPDRWLRAAVAAWMLKAPIHVYQWTLRPFFGWPCRHLPTCSDYALSAIDRNGAWKGLWLTASRLSRCHPWGTHGYDPVPDLSGVRHPLYAAYRYGRWTGRHLEFGSRVSGKTGTVVVGDVEA